MVVKRKTAFKNSLVFFPSNNKLNKENKEKQVESKWKCISYYCVSCTVLKYYPKNVLRYFQLVDLENAEGYLVIKPFNILKVQQVCSMIIKACTWCLIIIYIVPSCDRHFKAQAQSCVLNNSTGMTSIIFCLMKLQYLRGERVAVLGKH